MKAGLALLALAGALGGVTSCGDGGSSGTIDVSGTWDAVRIVASGGPPSSLFANCTGGGVNFEGSPPGIPACLEDGVSVTQTPPPPDRADKVGADFTLACRAGSAASGSVGGGKSRLPAEAIFGSFQSTIIFGIIAINDFSGVISGRTIELEFADVVFSGVGTCEIVPPLVMRVNF